MGSYKKIGLSHKMGLIDTPPLMKLHRKIKHNEKECCIHMNWVPTPKVKVAVRSEVKIVSQQ